MFMPSRPVRYETAARIMPKAGQSRQLHPFAVGQAEEEPVDDHGQDDAGGTGAAGRPQRREQPDERLEEQAAEEQLLHGGAKSTVAMAMTMKPPPCDAARQLLRGPVEVVDVVLERART